MKKENLKTKRVDEDDIPEEIDFSKAIKNPFAKLLKQQVTINLANFVVDYFKKESEEVGVPYQTLINLYLMKCVEEKRKITDVLCETIST